MTWGESIEVIDGPTEDGLYKVWYDGIVGWASGKYISFDGVGGTGGGWSERWIDVDRSSGIVTLYEGDNALASYWGAMGYDNSDYGYYATAIGTYYVYSFNRDLAWTEYGQAFITDWVAFDPKRNNGFHSSSLDENAMSSSRATAPPAAASPSNPGLPPRSTTSPRSECVSRSTGRRGITPITCRGRPRALPGQMGTPVQRRRPRPRPRESTEPSLDHGVPETAPDATGGRQDSPYRFERQRLAEVAVASNHGRRAEERVEDRFLRRFRGRLEERVDHPGAPRRPLRPRFRRERRPAAV